MKEGEGRCSGEGFSQIMVGALFVATDETVLFNDSVSVFILELAEEFYFLLFFFRLFVFLFLLLFAKVPLSASTAFRPCRLVDCFGFAWFESLLGPCLPLLFLVRLRFRRAAAWSFSCFFRELISRCRFLLCELILLVISSPSSGDERLTSSSWVEMSCVVVVLTALSAQAIISISRSLLSVEVLYSVYPVLKTHLTARLKLVRSVSTSL